MLKISSITLLGSIIISIILSTAVVCIGSEPSPAFDGEIVRLHVIANSDLEYDQMLKLKVRDSVLASSAAMNSSEMTLEFARANEENMRNAALETIKTEGFDYDVKIEVGVFPFPAKAYGDLVFPAGNYNAVRVIIGEGAGQNWWCVMFPPLCFVNETTAIMPEESKKQLSDETKDMLGDGKYKIKFKLAEFF